MSQRKKIAVIGAGLAGISLAKKLGDIADVTVFEKSRGVGGRMATRYQGDFVFDHGAQYFVAKTKAFKQFLLPYLEQGDLDIWRARFAEIEHGKSFDVRDWHDSPAHYVPVPKMNHFAKRLAAECDVYLGHCLTKVTAVAHQWQLSFANQSVDSLFDWVVFAAPAQQTQELLPDISSFKQEISNIDMLPCFSLMLGFDKPLALTWDVAVIKNDSLSFIAKNHSKPGRDEKSCYVVFSSNQWARDHFEKPIEEVKEHLLHRFAEVVAEPFARPRHVDIQRWRYANCSKQNGPSSFIDKPHKLAACGDWCIQGRVESAFTSAMHLARSLSQELR